MEVNPSQRKSNVMDNMCCHLYVSFCFKNKTKMINELKRHTEYTYFLLNYLSYLVIGVVQTGLFMLLIFIYNSSNIRPLLRNGCNMREGDKERRRGDLRVLRGRGIADGEAPLCKDKHERDGHGR